MRQRFCWLGGRLNLPVEGLGVRRVSGRPGEATGSNGGLVERVRSEGFIDIDDEPGRAGYRRAPTRRGYIQCWGVLGLRNGLELRAMIAALAVHRAIR